MTLIETSFGVRVENLVREGENASHQHFLLCLECVHLFHRAVKSGLCGKVVCLGLYIKQIRQFITPDVQILLGLFDPQSRNFGVKSQTEVISRMRKSTSMDT